MRYISTRGRAPVLGFEEAMLTGLARDGGLYLPERIPAMSHEEIRALEGQSYEEAAFRVMRPFIGNAFTDACPHDFTDAFTDAFPDAFPGAFPDVSPDA